MKYKKLTELLTVGALMTPNLLSTKVVSANELTKTTISSSDKTIETHSSDGIQTCLSILDNKKQPISDNTYIDENGNSVKFNYAEGATAKSNTLVNYSINISAGHHLTEFKLINETTHDIFLTETSKLSGTFTMPNSDISLQLVTESDVPTQSKGNMPTKDTQNKKQLSPVEHTGNSNDNQTISEQNDPHTQNQKSLNNQNSKIVSKPNISPSNKVQETQDYQSRPASTNVVQRDDIEPLSPTTNSIQNALVQLAYQQLGKPYIWGAKGPDSFDCSGLTYYIYANTAGHYIGGWTGDQQNSGTQISVSEAQPGDLLFWGAPTGTTSHVAIYVGNGQYIQAPQTGDVVKLSKLTDFMPDFAVRVNLPGLPVVTSNQQVQDLAKINPSLTLKKDRSTTDFINEIGESARLIGEKNDIYASVMIAQAILESSSGKSGLAARPNYNIFGMKGAYNGDSVAFNTMEQDNAGKSYNVMASFKKYPSYHESLDDYAKLLKDGIDSDPIYYRPTWKSETKSYVDVINYLQGHYATDKSYSHKLNEIIETYNLTTYDSMKTSPNRNTTFRLSSPSKFNSLDGMVRLKLYSSLRYPFLQTFSNKYLVSMFLGDAIIYLATEYKKDHSNNKNVDNAILPKTREKNSVLLYHEEKPSV